MIDEVLKVISSIIGVPVETLSEKSSQETVAYWDSLKHMNLILSLEEEFKVAFSDKEIMKMRNVKSILETLKRHIKA